VFAMDIYFVQNVLIKLFKS